MLIQYFEGFFECSEVFVRVVFVAQLAKEVCAALRPMQLVKVDPVGLQAFEAGIQGLHDVGAVVFELPVTNVIDAVARACDFAGQYPVGAVATAFKPIADIALGAGVGFCFRGDGVHLGGIDEVDTGVFCVFDLSEGFILSVLFAPGHGSEGDGAYFHVGAA